MFTKSKAMISTFAAKHPNAAAPVVAAALAVSGATSKVMVLAGDFNPSGATAKIVDWVTSIVLAVGLIYALIAGINFFSAIKEEDSARQSKSTINLFIALGICLIKPIVVLLLKAAGGTANDDAVKAFGG